MDSPLERNGFERSVPRQIGNSLWFRPSWGQSTGARSSEQLPASANRSSCRAAVRGAATHRPDQAASHQGRAVGGASASRNRRFESLPLQQRVGHEPHGQNRTRSRPEPKVRIQLSPAVSPQTLRSSCIKHTMPMVPCRGVRSVPGDSPSGGAEVPLSHFAAITLRSPGLFGIARPGICPIHENGLTATWWWKRCSHRNSRSS
jgi:hypothetical protein